MRRLPLRVVRLGSRLAPCALVALALGCAGPAPLPSVDMAGGQCEAGSGGSGGITVLLVKNPKKVQEYKASMAKLNNPAIAGDRHTMIFADGRMVTTSLERVGDWVNELGWSSRPISIQTASQWQRPILRRG